MWETARGGAAYPTVTWVLAQKEGVGGNEETLSNVWASVNNETQSGAQHPASLRSRVLPSGRISWKQCLGLRAGLRVLMFCALSQSTCNSFMYRVLGLETNPLKSNNKWN